MTKFIKKIPALSALILVTISVPLVALIYVGGNADSMDVAGEELTVPRFTDALLYWTYALVGFALGITVYMAIRAYVKNFMANPTLALKSLIPLALFVLLFIVAWNLGSGEKMVIMGYDGTENQGFWAQFSEMIIYTIYALFAAIGITIVGARIYVGLK